MNQPSQFANRISLVQFIPLPPFRCTLLFLLCASAPATTGAASPHPTTRPTSLKVIEVQGNVQIHLTDRLFTGWRRAEVGTLVQTSDEVRVGIRSKITL